MNIYSGEKTALSSSRRKSDSPTKQRATTSQKEIDRRKNRTSNETWIFSNAIARFSYTVQWKL